jgi:hypothetical protein
MQHRFNKVSFNGSGQLEPVFIYEEASQMVFCRVIEMDLDKDVVSEIYCYFFPKKR